MDIVEFLRSVEWMCHSNMRGLMENDRPHEAADEIERLREQVDFERASLQAAFGELRKLDGDIERLHQQNAELLGALGRIADVSEHCKTVLCHESIKLPPPPSPKQQEVSDEDS